MDKLSQGFQDSKLIILRYLCVIAQSLLKPDFSVLHYVEEEASILRL
jgi:hypothetical protein